MVHQVEIERGNREEVLNLRLYLYEKESLKARYRRKLWLDQTDPLTYKFSDFIRDLLSYPNPVIEPAPDLEPDIDPRQPEEK